VLAYLFATLTLALGCILCSKKLHEQLVEHVFHWPMEMFDTTPLGRVVNRFSKDVDVLDNTLPMLWRMLLSTTFSVINVQNLVN